MGIVIRIAWLLVVGIGLGARRHWHILLAILLGVALGLLASGTPEMTPVISFFDMVGQLFIRLISMLVLPLVISSLVVGITSIKDEEDFGRISLKTIAWFLFLMVTSAVSGWFLSLLLKPGLALRADLAHLLANSHQQLGGQAHQHALANTPGLMELLTNLIPTNPIAALSHMDMIPIIVFTVVFSLAINRIGEAGRPLTQFFESVFTATMKLTQWVMVLSVPGVFALTFAAVARMGGQYFEDLTPFATAVLIGLGLQLTVLFPLVLSYAAKISPVRFYQSISEAMMVGFGTASYSATLPITIACCEQRTGVSNRIASFVMPPGGSINKTATTMFEVMAVSFLAQALGIPFGPAEAVAVIALSIIASIAAPGVPSAGLITIAVITKSLGGNYAQIASAVVLLWPIDRLLDMFRTMVNIASSATVATVVAHSEGELNTEVLNNQVLWSDDVLKPSA
jgi:proton glutamate symport protein